MGVAEKTMTMTRSISLTVLATFLGQAMNFLVDVLIARGYGTSWRADAYYLALVIPIMLSEVFTNGINAVFIPMYSGLRGKEDGQRFFSAFLNSAFLLSLFSGAALFFFAPWIVGLVATGFTPGAKGSAVTLTRVLLILLLTLPIGAVLSNRLNAHGSFVLPALGKTFNFAFVMASLLFLGGYFGILSLPLGYAFGSAVFVATLFLSFARRGLSHKLKSGLSHPAMKEAGVLLLPFVIASAVNYVNVLVERAVAAGFSEGSISSLNYAFKLINMPVNLFIVGAMSVVLPSFSRFASSGDMEGLRDMVLKGLGLVSFLVLPVTALLIVLRAPIVSLLFERGEFTALSSSVTATAVLYYSFGIIGLASVHVMYRVFYALKGMRLLCAVSVCVSALNIAAVVLLGKAVGFIGVPLAFSLISTLHMAALLVLFDRKGTAGISLRFLRSLIIHSALSGVMALVSFGAMRSSVLYLDLDVRSNMAVALCFSVLAGGAFYIAASLALRIKEARFIFQRAFAVRRTEAL